MQKKMWQNVFEKFMIDFCAVCCKIQFQCYKRCCHWTSINHWNEIDWDSMFWNYLLCSVPHFIHSELIAKIKWRMELRPSNWISNSKYFHCMLFIYEMNREIIIMQCLNSWRLAFWRSLDELFANFVKVISNVFSFQSHQFQTLNTIHLGHI